MHFTSTLSKHSMPFFRRLMWRGKRGRFLKPTTRQLELKPNQVVNAIDLNEMFEEKQEDWQPPIDEPMLSGFRPISQHVDYHTTPVYEFNTRTRLLYGERQTLKLMKTQVFEGLPDKVKNIVGKFSIQDQDQLAQRYIMQANVWDPTKDKLPKRFNPALPGWKFKAETGIPPTKTTRILSGNILRLCMMLIGKHAEFLHSRRLVPHHYVSAYYNYKGSRIHINGVQDYMVSTNTPLPPYVDQAAVDESVHHSTPDLYPISPLLDLSHQNIYRDENITGWRDGYEFDHPHTFVMNFTHMWNQNHRNSISHAFCFAYALTQAKRLYGMDATRLPKPVCVQAINTNGQDFHLTCFQLNTLDYSSDDGVKNMVWFDNDCSLYKKILPQRAMLRNTKYEDYDPRVLQKVIALYSYGVDDVSDENTLDDLEPVQGRIASSV